MDPQVSVVIPNYNHQAYLEQRINTILNQTFQDFDLIILDDCSTDGSKEIIERYRSHPKVSFIKINDKNSGSLFKQWQKGINLARGKYIWIAESDDFAELQFLEKLVPILEADKNIGLVYADSKIVDSNGKYKGKLFSEFQNEIKHRITGSYVKQGVDELDEALAYWCTINNASAVLFRATALQVLKINLNDFYYAGDWATYMSIAKEHKIAYLHEALSSYRQHQSNASKKSYTSGKIFLDQFRIVSFCIRNQCLDQVHIRPYFLGRYSNLIVMPYKTLPKAKFIKLILNYFSVNPSLALKYFFEFLVLSFKGKAKQNL